MPRAVLDMISLVASFVCGRWWVLHNILTYGLTMEYV